MYRRILSWISIFQFALLTVFLWFGSGLSQDCRGRSPGMAGRIPSLQNAVNPRPLRADIELPMPCGGKLVLRHVCVPAEGFFGDMRLNLGCKDCGRGNYGFMEGRRKAAVSGPFTLEDLPAPWQKKLLDLAETGDGRCPDPRDPTATGFYYFIGKYEISNFQWKAVMEGVCPTGEEAFTAQDPRPKTKVSWFEAVEFTKRYTEWLLKNAPESLPRFSGGRFAYIRLPTEAEWEYAARGGHMVSISQLNQEDFFPLNGRGLRAYAVYTEPGAAKPPQKLSWIGSKCPNPLGLFDTAGNAAEMVLDPFRFSLGFRLHGAVGGFISKGGSYRKGRNEVLPGRREELPYFLKDGPYRGKDLGFRVVLSAIVTPSNRFESLGREWIKTSVRSRKSGTEPKGKEALPSLAAPQGESAKGTIQSALFTAESVVNCFIRRQAILYELGRLKFLKTRVLPEPALQALDKNISDVEGALHKLDLEIDDLVNFYLNRVKESGRYPQNLFDSQMRGISRELRVEEGFSQGLKSRYELLEMFERHVALYREQKEELRKEVVLADIAPSSVGGETEVGSPR